MAIQLKYCHVLMRLNFVFDPAIDWYLSILIWHSTPNSES